MPGDSDPDSGRAFIWLITCILFISILAGGGCLLAYIVLPESQTSPLIPILGVTLVCLPWAFWFLTCLYRIFSRWCCGDRDVPANYNYGGRGFAASASNTRRNADLEVASQSGKGSHLNRASSVASNESEAALASSMAS
ncbi:uncharacterized protein LOC107480170 [Arachis duranensis]|nr:uncharacterized protein LOC107480170 [Arachis duranensis]XP_016193525.1 uncharacterized protein LOC107634618 [Arachis ipaensis]XP_025640667.1 uncharacterized protein LOC112735333 [Arachis hypogaea]XP_025680292.1 uncharacterized protein LOC112780403 [Arachis hypogaea]XP_057748941.1 uncharacterized protein LOC130967912 [Arachis stenosperma]RYR66216.1 hypothetical protein Ahy_A03g012191 [Arachis hypogaea]